MVEVDSGGFLAFIVKESIAIGANVGYKVDTNAAHSGGVHLPGAVEANVQGIYVADNLFTVLSNNDDNAPDRKLLAAGTFVGWNGINLNRTFDDGLLGKTIHRYNPTETFIYRPDFLINMPAEMKSSVQIWQEVAPRKTAD